MRNVFVDGYNVINSWPQLNKIKEYSFEAARNKLIEIMQNYGAYNGYKIFLVFDAHLVKGSIEKKERMSNLMVVFTKEGETADSFIERYVNNIGRKVEVCVVTSDSLEQQVTFQRGATRMSSIEFYNEVKTTTQKISNKTKKNISANRTLLEDRIDKKVLEKLEKIRKSR
ncbi:RNA-binding protein [Clostridium novyi A str. 4552]|uniref:RNA-binding protein n=1 Tax=Clostridium novyi A str. 4552 TaxID=1444289 RepID=A0A0A0I3S7_CLONO|nr:NYN domain-containing protein [Clostridium novyi]KGM95248.1 RNA-binding protein [Clostridium novyi A str. 4552]